MSAFMNLLLGLALRLGIPLLITAGVFLLLRRLDRRWQTQAEALPVLAAAGKPCWETRQCPEEKKQACPAFANSGQPCWQTFRARDGVMMESCLGCAVFRQARRPAVV